MGILDWLPFFNSKTDRENRHDAEKFQSLLAARYHHFKLLLNADSENHDIITDIEQALRGESVYGMAFVRSTCTRTITATYQMISHLDSLAPGKYEKLFDAFRDIRSRIEPHIARKEFERGGRLVLDLEEVNRTHADLCGSKMASLGEAGSVLKLTVPPGFVVTAEAFRRFMEEDGLGEEILCRLQATDKNDRDAVVQATSNIMQMVIASPLPQDVERAILEAYDRLLQKVDGEVRLALRSSALGEDSERTTFAGQYRSILNVDRDGMLDAYREVVASKYSLQALAYRLNRGIRSEDVAMCVGCMNMVRAASGGVAYSRSPVDYQDDNVTVYSVWGLPKAVVDGSSETDTFTVSRYPMRLVHSDVVHKAEKYICRPGEGTTRVQTAERADYPSLSDKQVISIAEAAVTIEQHFGTPQDIEWALSEDGDLHLLQCRPLPRPTDDDSIRTARNNISNLPPPFLSGGVTASPGVGCGKAYVVRKDADALGFPDQGVLVLQQALPRRASLLSRASAVIAERGGAAGHLANVAREFNIPALFGLRGVAENLDNGQNITVDADGHALYLGTLQDLVDAGQCPRKDLMRGSEVRAALRGAARHIIRLHMLDPDSPEFRPRNCRTLHDIMRFCHETAVREMFSFGMEKSYVQAASRQLVCDVPKQFWVLNLDDGFTKQGQDRDDSRVAMDEILSVPMHALWDGMIAVSWDGPPPVNAKGFLSVMFEATVNPNLTAASASNFTMRNYFIISKNFCSLQSRFGFHFCGAESLVGDRPGENYARFHFKGGAANLDRRIRRARFIKEILESFDFRVKLRQDNLTARLEGYGRPTMEHRLRVLGYLIIHTRQLDMVMTDRDAVEKLRKKIMNDLKQFGPGFIAKSKSK